MKPEKLRNLLRDIMRGSPQASEKQIRNLCWNKCANNADLQRALFDYWFGNSYRDFTIEAAANSTAILAVRRTRASNGNGAHAVTALKNQMKACLMDFALSDGTPLREATFGQCAREGNWLTAISKCGHAHEVVGKKLTESDLQNLMARFLPPAPRQRATGARKAA